MDVIFFVEQKPGFVARFFSTIGHGILFAVSAFIGWKTAAFVIDRLIQ